MRMRILLVCCAALAVVVPSALGGGAPSSIAWSPSGSYDYGAVTPGQTASNTFTLTNSGGSATGMVTVALSESGSAAYSIASDGCTGTALGKGKSCAVTVQFAPTTAGQSYTATLSATGKKPPHASASITLTGSGAVSAPVLTVTKDNDANHDDTYSDTETVPANAPFPYRVTYKATITNSSGSSAATITAIADDKAAPPLHSASTTDTDCADVIGTSIASGATVTCYYDVTFNVGTASQVINTVIVTATNSAGSDTKTDRSMVTFVVDLTLFPPATYASTAANGQKFYFYFGTAPGPLSVPFLVVNTGNVASQTLQVQGGGDGLAVNTGSCAGISLPPQGQCFFTLFVVGACPYPSPPQQFNGFVDIFGVPLFAPYIHLDAHVMCIPT